LVTCLARGKLLRTIKKKIREETLSRLEGVRKFYKKHPEQTVFDAIRQLFGNTSFMDVAKLGAVFGMTFIVKKVIDKTEELRMLIDEYKLWVGPTYAFPFALIQGYTTGFRVPTKEEIQKYEGMFPDIIDWVIAFCFAWIIINHFGEIMQGVGSIGVGVKGILMGLLS
jgi:hypothetical protein